VICQWTEALIDSSLCMPVSNHHVRKKEEQDAEENAPSDNLSRLQES
jgi:hypothetical protein